MVAAEAGMDELHERRRWTEEAYNIYRPYVSGIRQAVRTVMIIEREDKKIGILLFFSVKLECRFFNME